MKNKITILLIGFVVIIFILGCTYKTSIHDNFENETEIGYPITSSTSYSTSYPVVKENGDQLSAFQAYPIAKAAALEWNPNSILYSLPATGVMEMNFGFPPLGSGWFYLFKTESDMLEFYILVENNEISGTTEAQPIIVGERSIKYLPLPPLEEMLDSSDVYKIFFENGGERYIKDNPETLINLQLEFVESNSFPTWTVFAINQSGVITALMNINALTGEVVE